MDSISPERASVVKIRTNVNEYRYPRMYFHVISMLLVLFLVGSVRFVFISIGNGVVALSLLFLYPLYMRYKGILLAWPSKVRICYVILCSGTFASIPIFMSLVCVVAGGAQDVLAADMMMNNAKNNKIKAHFPNKDANELTDVQKHLKGLSAQKSLQMKIESVAKECKKAERRALEE